MKEAGPESRYSRKFGPDEGSQFFPSSPHFPDPTTLHFFRLFFFMAIFHLEKFYYGRSVLKQILGGFSYLVVDNFDGGGTTTFRFFVPFLKVKKKAGKQRYISHQTRKNSRRIKKPLSLFLLPTF